MSGIMNENWAAPSAKKLKLNEHEEGELEIPKGLISDDEEEDDEKPEIVTKTVVKVCPYLDTINRHVLDFDFEKLCSVSLSHLNVYACLICGKYFQGRGRTSHAYTHSVNINHHVFINLHTLRFYCLPDNYEVEDSSLEDIKYILNPTFTKKMVYEIDHDVKLVRAKDGSMYYPGVLGLNNIKANDYCNVVLQALCQVHPLRNYFLRPENYASIKRPAGDILENLSRRFGELVRKLWNPRAFKTHVSPHEMLQAVVLCSKKSFQITEQGDPVEFMSWFLNALHASLNGTKGAASSIVYKTFRGSIRIISRKVLPTDATDAEKKELLMHEEFKDQEFDSPFLYLMVDLPPSPLFKNEMDENVIPQIPLNVLMEKFDGVTEKEYRTYKDSTVKRFRITKLPPYLILCLKRFTKNNFFVEKNPTIVNFPVKNIDLVEYLLDDEEIRAKNPNTVYDLVANIVHDGTGQKNGSYKSHVFHEGSGKWFEMQDLHVTDILPQMITLSESYIQIYKMRKSKKDSIAKK